MRVGILAYDTCLASGVHGFSDTLAVANLLMGRNVFETAVLSVSGGPARCFSGAVVRADAALTTRGRATGGGTSCMSRRPSA